MRTILDETSLVPCPVWSPAARALDLARSLQAFDGLGAPRVLRSVRDAADRDIGNGFGLRIWCFDRATDRDAGRLLATRLASQPFIDGAGGLFAVAEGVRAVEAAVNGASALGAGLAALTDGVVDAERWSLHTKLTGGGGPRLYFRAVRPESGAVVLIGYFGDHLPTVKYPT